MDCRRRRAVIFHHDAAVRREPRRRRPEEPRTTDARLTARHTTILWLRRDLRLGDNPALLAAAREACDRRGALLPVFVWEPPGRRAWAPGGAARWWLLRSLESLDAQLRRLGSRLHTERGDPVAVITALAAEPGAGAVVWAEGLDPEEMADDAALRAALGGRGVETVVVPQANLLAAPLSVRTREGRPYTVFAPYWRARLAAGAPDEPLATPATLPPAPGGPTGLALAELEPEAIKPWSAGFVEVWQPGERGAEARLDEFLAGPLDGYAADRDRLDLDGGSRLSPHLHWGEITARQVWHAVRGTLEEAGLELEAAVGPPGRDGEQAPGLRRSAGAFLRQLGWREFGHHLLTVFPQTHDRAAAQTLCRLPLARRSGRARGLAARPDRLPRGGCRHAQLWATGWMHNRARLFAGSFLVKHLLQPWQQGSGWFWDTLLDADLANNSLGWQWVAGCGADAAPYFRIFNPVTQGRRYDPDGAYVRRWVPELAGLDVSHLHAPWLAPAAALRAAGVTLGETYPQPLVDHGRVRLRALAAYELVRAR